MIAGFWPIFPRFDLIIVIVKQTEVLTSFARMEAAQESYLEIFVCPPVDVSRIFISELNGLYLNRVCPETLFLA